jgi:hypothetical protein
MSSSTSKIELAVHLKSTYWWVYFNRNVDGHGNPNPHSAVFAAVAHSRTGECESEQAPCALTCH